jgi:hypothetical protein
VRCGERKLCFHRIFLEQDNLKMADMEVDSPAVGASVQAGKKKKQDGPRFEVKKVSGWR